MSCVTLSQINRAMICGFIGLKREKTTNCRSIFRQKYQNPQIKMRKIKVVPGTFMRPKYHH